VVENQRARSYVNLNSEPAHMRTRRRTMIKIAMSYFIALNHRINHTIRGSDLQG
jgi:hypothetical protein